MPTRPPSTDGMSDGLYAGVSVMADMLFTTHFMVLIMLCVWRTPLWCPILFYAVFAPIEGAYLSSVLLKVPTGTLLNFPMEPLSPSASGQPCACAVALQAKSLTAKAPIWLRYTLRFCST